MYFSRVHTEIIAQHYLEKLLSKVKFIETKYNGFVERDVGSGGLMSLEFQFCKMKKFWRFVAQQCEYTWHYWTVTFKINSTLCVFTTILKITWKNENIKHYLIKRGGEEKSHPHETKYMQYFYFRHARKAISESTDFKQAAVYR